MMTRISMYAVLAVAIVTLASSANASILINFNTPTTNSVDFTKAPAAGGGSLPINSVFLVYASTDNSTSGFNTSNPMSPSGDTLLTASGLNTGDGLPDFLKSTGEIMGYSSGVSYSGVDGQYIYIAVFDYSYASFTGGGNTIPVGTYYQLVGPQQINAWDGTSPPTQFSYASGPFVTSLQTVPEPTTAALLGLGLGLIAIRRKLRV